jgi:hypothetical protein
MSNKKLHLQCNHKREQSVEQQRCDDRGRSHRRNRLPDGGIVQRKHDGVEEIGEARAGCLVSNRPVPAEEEERRRQDVPWNFDEELGGEKGSHGVHPGRALADFIDRTDCDEHRLELLSEGHSEDRRHEDGLRAKDRSVHHPTSVITRHAQRAYSEFPSKVFCVWKNVNPTSSPPEMLRMSFAKMYVGFRQ